MVPGFYLSNLARIGDPRGHAAFGHNDDALISMGERWGLVRTWELMAADGR